MKTLEQVINYATETLPEGYILSVSVEKGSAWVEFIDSDGEFHHIDGADQPLVEQAVEAIALIKEYRLGLNDILRRRRKIEPVG